MHSLFPQIDGTICTGLSITRSLAGGTPTNVIDGNTATSDTMATFANYWTIDLGSIKNICKFKLYASTGYYRIYFSTTGAFAGEEYYVVRLAQDGQRQYINYNAWNTTYINPLLSARYMKIYNEANNATLHEVELYETPTTPFGVITSNDTEIDGAINTLEEFLRREYLDKAVVGFISLDATKYLQIDLGSLRSITQIYSYVTNYCSYYIKVSTTGAFSGEEVVVWNNLANRGPNVGYYDTTNLPYTARYVRFIASGNSVISEIDVYEADPTQQTINSDTKIKGTILETIDSDTKIKGTISQTINSDTKVVLRTPQTINSDTKIKGTILETIDSDTVIVPLYYTQNILSNTKIVERTQEGINSDVKVVNREQENINSDAKIVLVTQKTITSNVVIKGFVDFIGRMRFQIASTNDFITRFKVNQPTPTAPTLSGIDLETGNSVYLSWTDAGNYGYNVYAFIGGVWVKQNVEVVINLSFVVGSLTNGTPYTFMVRGVNGEGTESTNSNSVIVTPTFSKSRVAIYKVYVGGVLRTDVILKSVEIVYGPSFSTAVFEILKPVTSPPATDDEMYITINDRRVFTGRIVTTDDRTSSGGLSIEYTCVCKLWEYTWDTVRRDYNTDDDLDAGILFYTTGILQNIGVPYSGLPANYPGQVGVKDSTKLSVMTTVLGYCGNYKIYTDPYGTVRYYKMGTGPNRILEVGKQILEQDIRTDISEKVDKVTVYNEYSQQIDHTSQVRSDELDNVPNKGYLVKDIYGYKVSDVQVEVLRRKYPEISYMSGLEILPGHVGLEKWPNGDTNAKAPVVSDAEFSSEWTGLSATVDYESRDRAKVYIPFGTSIANPRPTKNTYIATLYDSDGNVQYESVTLVIGDYYMPTMIRVTYKTERDIRISSIVGSGRVKRTFNEDRGNIYQRAQAEYDKLSIPTIGGEIIILGDETMDLCTKVNSMDVTRVLHDFSEGFITRLTLSNEPYYRAVLGNVQKVTTMKTKETIKKVQIISTYEYISQTRLKYLSGLLGIDPNIDEDPKLGGAHYAA